MTTIAWDGKTVAADTQAELGPYTSPVPHYKIKREEDVVYAISGTFALFQPLITWHRSGAFPSSVPKVESDDASTVLLVFEGNRCFALTPSLPYPDECFAPDAWGTGARFAIGAMKAGCDAKRAVEIAIECDVHSGGDVTTALSGWG
jgi:hypothetical protein